MGLRVGCMSDGEMGWAGQSGEGAASALQEAVAASSAAVGAAGDGGGAH